MTSNILDIPMGPNDAHAATIRDYLKTLLYNVWEYQEGFDGKRPFGNSGWDYELIQTVIEAGLAESGDVDHAADLIGEAIEEL